MTGFVDETVVSDAFAGKLVFPASVAVIMPERDVEIDLSLELVPLTVETSSKLLKSTSGCVRVDGAVCADISVPRPAMGDPVVWTKTECLSG